MDILTTGDLAKKLGVSTGTIRNWARAQLIIPELTTLGGHHRWVENHVRAKLKAARQHSG